MNDMFDMYGDSGSDDNEQKSQSFQQKISLISKPVHSEIVIDGRTIKIIDPDYVTMLEKRLHATERMIAAMQTSIARLDDNYRNKVRDIERLRTTLNNKIDKAS